MLAPHQPPSDRDRCAKVLRCRLAERSEFFAKENLAPPLVASPFKSSLVQAAYRDIKQTFRSGRSGASYAAAALD